MDLFLIPVKKLFSVEKTETVEKNCFPVMYIDGNHNTAQTHTHNNTNRIQ